MKSILILLIAVVLTSCSAFEALGTPDRRTQKLTSTEPASTDIGDPTIILDQEILNCNNDALCELEPFGTKKSEFYINSLITAESVILDEQNMNNAIAISFIVSGLDNGNINNVTYVYTKKDDLGNIIIQLEEKDVNFDGTKYIIPINTNNLGSSIINSAPYEQHSFRVKISTSDNKEYVYEIGFNLLSTYQDPITINRVIDILDSSYYKMDQDLSDFVIDSVEITNLLPYSITVDGSINVNSSTVGILSNTHRLQTKSFLPHPTNYPWDQYIMSTNTTATYHKATAEPTYKLIMSRNNSLLQELSIAVEEGSNYDVINFSELNLLGNEKIKLDLVIHLDSNNSILGEHGTEPFLEGQTICDDVNINSDCRCFYYVPDLHTANQLMYGLYGCGILMAAMANKFYPDCNAPQDNACLNKFLDVVNYPKDLFTLVGRHHRTNTGYTLTSWLKGYKNYDSIGSYTRTFDTIEVIKGELNYGIVDASMSFYGYIPGQI